MYRLIVMAGLILSAVSMSSHAQTESAAHHEDSEAAHSSGGAHSDTAHGPNYGLLTVDGMTAVWTIAVFVVLLVMLRSVAWKPIQAVLQQREKFIIDSLASAKREREEATRVLADYQQKIHKSREEATAIVEEGKRDAEAVRKRIHGEAKAEADAMVARAKRDIEIARDDAIKTLYDQTVVLATAVASKVVRKELSAGDHRRLVDEALADMGRMRN